MTNKKPSSFTSRLRVLVAAGTAMKPGNVQYPQLRPSKLRPLTSAILLIAGGAMALIAFAGTADTSWQQVPFRPHTVITPGARHTAGSTYDEARGVVVVFGGFSADNYNPAGFLDDTWTWDGTNWTEHHPATKPRSRGETQMAYHPGTGKAILFGGYSADSVYAVGAYLNDTWSWDGSNWTQISTPISPPPRSVASLAYDPASQMIVLFGGYNRDPSGEVQYLNDTWVFDGTNWAQAQPVTSPSGRWRGELTYVPANGLLLFGGRDDNGSLNDTWVWKGNNWTQLSPAASPPALGWSLLEYHAAASTAVLYVHAGREGETWTWDGTNWQKSASASPYSRVGSVYVYHPGVRRVLLYSGGGGFCGTRDDQWTWNGSSWEQTDLGERFPPSRGYVSGQMAFDTDRNESILFSGASACGVNPDTWAWDGSNWTQRRPSTKPPGRSDASMAYDPERKVTVLFGGRDFEVKNLNDTWVFDGFNWIKKTPSTSPLPRSNAMMAFDKASKKVVLFGGNASPSGLVTNETWTWDGSDWTEEHPLTSPAGRCCGNMSPDAEGRPILFGGTSRQLQSYGDTWRWNGVSRNWEQVLTAIGPLPRSAASMGYDARSQRIILFGGNNRPALGYLPDTWAFDGTLWQQLSPASSPNTRAFAAMSDGSVTNPPVLMGGGRLLGMPENTETWTWGIPLPPVQLVSVLSRKVHGASGPFDIDLPIAGTRGVECRSGGANRDYTMIFKFANELTSVDGTSASATQEGGGNQSVTATGSINAADRKEYIVNLTGVPNAQVLTVSLANVSDSTGNSSASVSASMGILLGDTSGEGVVNSGDITQVRRQSGQVTAEANKRIDLSVDGVINSADITLVRRQSGTALPTP